MAWAGQEIENPEIGERVRFIHTAADTHGELLETEQWLAPGGSAGVLHVHPEQEERFTVISGALRVRIAGTQREYGPSESAFVPSGTAHVFENASSGTTHFRGEVRPALRTEEFFERLASLAQQNAATPEKRLSPMTLAPLISEYRREVALPRLPALVQHAAIGLLCALARRRGGGELPPLAVPRPESTTRQAR
jgi:mannose-6-phosphate isomerase-like protein (cupin superfamily)